MLGEGAMGRVYLAFDPKFGREVALKVIQEHMLADEKVRKWFHREARAMAQLQHPGIVEVHDYSGTETHEPYLVMERLHGHTLKDVVDKRGVCSPLVLCEIAIQLGAALEHAHSQGLIHRDLKPDNVFVEPNGRIVITDFGLARAQMNVDLGASLASMGTAVVGTPLFLAPETIHEPKSASPKSDIYAIGVLLYYAATLKTPFFGDDAFQTLSRILSGQHPKVHELRKDLPKALCEQIERAFAFDAAQRPQTGGELEAAFSALVEPGEDPHKAIVAFLQQTDEFNAFTVATAINVQSAERNIPTPQPVETEKTQVATVTATATVTTRTPRPNDSQTVMQTVKALKGGGGDTVVALSTDSHEVQSPSRLPIIVGVLVAFLVATAVLLYVTRKKPAPPPPVTVQAQPTPPPKEPDLPAPPPTEVLAVPAPAPETPDPPAHPRPVVKKDKEKEAPKEPGTLRVNTGSVYADIIINGEKRGQTPFKPTVELPPGRYTVKLSNPDFPVQQHTVVIVSGEITPLKATLGKK